MPRPAVLADLLFISVICLRPMQLCSLPLCRRFSPTPRPRWRVLVWAVNSPGGSVSAGMAIYDTMQYIPCDLATVCFGTAASMGAFLLCSGTPGKRKSLPNSRIMIHQPLGGAQGQAADIEIQVCGETVGACAGSCFLRARPPLAANAEMQAKEILFVKSLLNSYMADATGQPLDKIEEDTDRDFFMTPEEAMEYGIIDEVRSSFPLFACVEALAHTPLLERYVCDVARMVGELWRWMPKFRRVRRQLVYSQALASQHSNGVSRCHFAASLPLRTHFPWQF